MKLYYIANLRIPTEKAHGIQVMKMCESFARAGADITLVLPRKRNPIIEDPILFYGIQKPFPIIKLPMIDFGSSSAFFFTLSSVTFYISLFFFLLNKKSADTVLYTRGEVALVLARLLPQKKFFWETHIKPEHMRRYMNVLSRASGIITVTRYYADELVHSFGAQQEKLLVAPDAVELQDFVVHDSKEACRGRLNLPIDKHIVVYTGHLYDWKGVDTLAETAEFLPEDTLLVFVGGTTADVSRFKKQYGDNHKIQIVGQKPYHDIKYYLKSADVLVLPNSGKSTTSQFYTSPLKLFEYMTSLVPIVVSDLVSMREILTDESAVFFEPDNAKDLAEKIRSILADTVKAETIAQKAYQDVLSYTWEKRGYTIFMFIKKLFHYES